MLINLMGLNIGNSANNKLCFYVHVMNNYGILLWCGILKAYNNLALKLLVTGNLDPIWIQVFLHINIIKIRKKKSKDIAQKSMNFKIVIFSCTLRHKINTQLAPSIPHSTPVS
jgi:hypothetical protein